MIYFFKFLFISLYLVFPEKILANNIYLIENNEVVVSQQDILEAREIAKKIVFKEAFMKLLKIISHTNEQEKFFANSEINYSELIRDYSIEKEEYFNFEYKALINVNFDGEKINSFLQDMNLDFSGTSSEEYLVLPIHYHLNTYFLWEKNNKWYHSLKKEHKENSLLKLYFPNLSILNKFKISFDDALNNNVSAIEDILLFYNKKSALIIFLDEKFDFKTESFISNLNIKVFSDGMFKELSLSNKNFSDYLSKKSEIDFFAKLSLDELNDWWKNIITVSSDKERINTFKVNFNFNDFEESINIQNVLQKNSFIKKLDTVHFSKQSITYNISTYGSIEKLKLALRSINLKIEPIEKSMSYKLMKLE